MLKDKTFEEVVDIMNALSPTKLKHLYDLALKINYDDEDLYSRDMVRVDINGKTKRTILTYKKKIGYTLHNEMKELQTRRGKVVMVIGNAGGGKTYIQLKVASELDLESEDNNVAYIFIGPGSKQMNQNEVNDDLWEFNFKSVVGVKNKLKTDDGEHFSKKLKKGHRKFSVVYDLAYDVVKEAKAQGLEVVLVVDECHKLVSHFRGDAIKGVRKAMEMADMVTMMTATPEKCLLHFKYDEIIELIDEDAQTNIGDFNITYTDKCDETLRREIYKALTFKTRPLVKLDWSLDDINALAKSLEEEGYIVEVLSSKNADSKVFQSIVENGIIPDGIDIVLCTSTVEAGISLKSKDITPIMVCNNISRFSSDNTIQFFARPRNEVNNAVLILKNTFEDIKKALADMKGLGNNPEYKKVYGIEYYMNRANAEANEMKITMSRDFKELCKTCNVRAAVDYIKDRMAREFKRTKTLVQFDEYSLEFYVDKVGVIERACQLRDMALIGGGLPTLQTFFMNKIFYDKLTISYDDVEALPEEEKKALKEKVKATKEKKKEANKNKKAKDEEYREYFKDEEFLKLLPDLVSNKLDVMSIKKYNTDKTLKELKEFKKSSAYKVLVNAVHFSIDEIARMMTSRYVECGEYMSLSDIERMCDTASNVIQNGLGAHNNDKSSYNVLVPISDYFKTKGNTKAPERVMISKNLFIILYCELVRTKQSGFTSPKIKKILEDAPSRSKFNWKTYYTDKKISALEKALTRKDGSVKPASMAKLVKELQQIYNINTQVKNGKEYLCIDSKLKSFDFEYHLNNLLNSK